MSLNIISKFQLKLYNLIASDDNLGAYIKGVYVVAEHDAIYPFILINVSSLVNHTKFHRSIYSANFTVSIFARDKNQTLLSQSATRVQELLVPEKCAFGSYIIAGMKLSEVATTQAGDMVSVKLAMQYNALIKEVEDIAI